jgi:transcriptional regulator GlxA family with amidase domain
MSPKRIGLVGFDHCTALHLVGPADAFTAAVLLDGFGNRIRCYETCIIGRTPDCFRAESGLVFTPQDDFSTAPLLDTIIIPGGNGIRDPEVNASIAIWLSKRAHYTRRIAAVCTGIYGLAPTGLLDGREVTTHWRFSGDVARRFPKLRVNHNRSLIKDGPFFTSTGLTAGIELALALIEDDYGPQVARSVGQEMVMHLAPDHANAKAGQLQYDSQPIDRFGELVGWVVRNLNADLSVEALARRACMCPNHFSRAFKSVFGCPPSEFVENLRLNEAKRRLEARSKTLSAVAASVGFASSETFRRAFKRRFGIIPSTLLKNDGIDPLSMWREANRLEESVTLPPR